jgi:hypothetical protein
MSLRPSAGVWNPLPPMITVSNLRVRNDRASNQHCHPHSSRSHSSSGSSQVGSTIICKMSVSMVAVRPKCFAIVRWPTDSNVDLPEALAPVSRIVRREDPLTDASIEADHADHHDRRKRRRSASNACRLELHRSPLTRATSLTRPQSLDAGSRTHRTTARHPLPRRAISGDLHRRLG